MTIQSATLAKTHTRYTHRVRSLDLLQKGIEMISPHRANRKPENKTQDGRQLRRYKRRWTVERTIGRLQNYRRLCIRWEKSTAMFQGFINLTRSLLLLKEVLG